MNTTLFVLTAVFVLKASEFNVKNLETDDNPKFCRQQLAKGFVNGALSEGFFPNPMNDQEKKDLIDFHSKDSGYWTTYCANKLFMKKYFGFKPNFDKIAEKSNEKNEDPGVQEKWRKTYNEMRKILHPKAVEGKTSLYIKTTYPPPLTELQKELSWLIKKVEENPGNSRKKEQTLKARKKRIIEIKSLMNPLLLKLEAQKAVRDVVIASFFKLKNTLAYEFGDVNYVMKLFWSGLMESSSFFVFSIENPIEEPKSVYGPYPFATRFEMILQYIKKSIQQIAPENEIEYWLMEGDAVEVPFQLKIPKEKKGIENDLLIHIQHIGEIPTRLISAKFKSHGNQVYDVFFFGEANQLKYFLYIFELLYERLLDEEKPCLICDEICDTVLLHEFKEKIGNFDVARNINILTINECKKYVKYQMKNDEHRLCQACFLSWFKKMGSTSCPKCRYEFNEVQIKDLESEINKIM